MQAFARAKQREKARVQATATLLASGAGVGSEHGGGDDDLLMGRALVGGSGGGGAAVATVLGHGPQTPMRQVCACVRANYVSTCVVVFVCASVFSDA